MVDYVAYDIVIYDDIVDGLPDKYYLMPLSIDMAYVRTEEISMQLNPWYYPRLCPSSEIPDYVNSGVKVEYSNSFYWLTCIRNEEGYPSSLPRTLYYKAGDKYYRFDYEVGVQEGLLAWLYRVGNTLVETSSNFFKFMPMDIMGYDFFTILFGGAMLVYMGWSVVKWIIPL